MLLYQRPLCHSVAQRRNLLLRFPSWHASKEQNDDRSLHSPSRNHLRRQIEASPMIARYTRPAMGKIWSDENKYRCCLPVDIAASQALAKFGLVPQSAADAIRDKGAFTVDRINEIEAEVKHDVIAFTTAVAEHINEPAQSRWLHYGLTSTDVVDTAQSLQLKEASAIIRAGIVALSDTLKRRAIESKHTPITCRTLAI